LESNARTSTATCCRTCRRMRLGRWGRYWRRRWDEGGDKRHTIGTYKLRTGMGFIS